MNKLSVYAVFLLIGIVSARPPFCGAGSYYRFQSVGQSFIISGMGYSSDSVKALINFQRNFCAGLTLSAATWFALAANYDSVINTPTIAEALKDASGYSAIDGADVVAKAFKGTAEPQAKAIARTIGYTYGRYGDSVVSATAEAFAKAVVDDYLSGLPAAAAFAEAYAQANLFGKGKGFVLAAAKAGAQENCANFRKLLAEAFTRSFSWTYSGFAEAVATAETKAKCLKDCCGCTMCN